MSARVAEPIRTRLVRISAALAARADDALDATLRELAAAGEEAATAVEEALLQSYLFLGYPIGLEGFRRWRLASEHAPLPAPDDWEGWTRRGAELCRTVYGGEYDELRANVRALHPDMERWMVAEGYGKVLGRPGLPLADRELCIVAMLAVLDAPRQLYSHLRGALHAGAAEREVEATLAEVDPFCGAAAREHARSTWERVRARVAARAGRGV